MKRPFLISICISLLFSYAIADLPEPYNSLKTLLPFNDHGWYTNRPQMDKLLRLTGSEIVIELGVWMGRSARHIASALPEEGILYAVDHWLGSEENLLKEDDRRVLPTLYEQFLSNTIHANLTHKIIPMRMTTLEAAEIFLKKGIKPDLIYVDASHDEDSIYADLSAYFPLIKGHGKICGDDWEIGIEKGYPTKKAVTRFAQENDLILESSGNFWVLHEYCSCNFFNH